jgi:hypothetical protein
MKIRNGQLNARRVNKRFDDVISVGAAAPVNGVAAALTTALAGGNNDLVFTAKTRGAAGNDITIRYVIAAGATAVTVVGSAITVTCATGTLASAVKTAIEGNAAANALVAVANAAANDGTAAVIALAATALSGGVDCTVAEACSTIHYNGYHYFTPTKATKSSNSWVKSAQFGAL